MRKLPINKPAQFNSKLVAAGFCPDYSLPPPPPCHNSIGGDDAKQYQLAGTLKNNCNIFKS